MEPFGHLIYEFNKDLDYHHNIGDEVQTLAALRLLGLNEHNTIPINREQLNQVNTKHPKINLVMNGWFLNSINWPPSNQINPIFFSFHISRRNQATFLTTESINYLKQHEPIGCRDHGTKALLEAKGVKCFHSWCLTLTLPKREKSPEDGLVYLAIENKKLRKIVPKKIRKQSILVYHNIRLPCNIDNQHKLNIARNVYETYKNHAKLIITDKIHCAMPAIAMGIPVIFIAHRRMKRDYRIHIIDDLIGINYVRTNLLVRFYYRFKINWQPKALNINSLKKQIIQNFKQFVEKRAI